VAFHGYKKNISAIFPHSIMLLKTDIFPCLLTVRSKRAEVQALDTIHHSSSIRLCKSKCRLETAISTIEPGHLCKEKYITAVKACK